MVAKLILIICVSKFEITEMKRSGVEVIWGFSSVGRAPALHAGGQGFESLNLHCPIKDNLSTAYVLDKY